MLQLPHVLEGCKVFPCIAGEKVPAIPNGWKGASSDPAQIAAWEREFPGCNWAVATGLSGLFVIDIDPEGLETWKGMLDGNPDLRFEVERAYTVQTPRNGLHIYFRGDGPSTASRIASGIDTRGGIRRDDGSLASGGYVLLPGSQVGLGVYRAMDAGELHHYESAIAELIPERKSSLTHGLEKDPDKDQPRNVEWVTNLLKGYADSGRVSVQGKGGNDLAFRVAASVLDKAISPALAFDLLEEHWNPHCQPPWDDWELERIIENAAKYGEETEGGSKGFQANSEAFAHFAGQQPTDDRPEKISRDRLMWLHDYADSVEDPTWLIPGVLPAQGTGMIYGASGSYKSFLTLDMALCLAFGRPGQWQAPPVKNDVLFLAGEGPVATAKKRWPAWMEWQEIEDRSAHRIILKNRVPFYHDTEAWEHIRDDLAEMQVRPALIVIDTLSRLLTGLDENSSKDATMIVGFMEQLAQHYECFVLAIHHTGKDEKKGARGSSVFHANMDAVIATRLRPGGTELRIKKQKDADVPDEPQFFQVREMAQSIVLERTEMLPEEPKAGATRTDWSSPAEIVAILNSHGGELAGTMLATEISGKLGIDVNHVRKKLAAAADLKYLHSNGIWRLPKQEWDL